MWLHNLHIVGQEGEARDIYIENGRINKIKQKGTFQTKPIVFEDALVFQGLINSHDHLEYNLFPRLRSAVYEDYTQWGSDIHSKYKTEIDNVLQVPLRLRIEWGILKNFFNGITTVVDHGTNSYSINPLVEVFNKYNYLHSIGLEKYWKIKLNNPFNRSAVMIHIGEGVNNKAIQEIDELIRWNLFRKNLIGVHGIAMTKQQAKCFDALIWCPDSNLYLYNATAPINKLKQHTNILFGTDSSLSASSNLWVHLRLARKLHYLNNEELFATLTTNPSNAFGFEQAIVKNSQADLVIARRKGNDDLWDSFYAINPEDILMIIKKGEIMYFDAEIVDQINKNLFDLFGPIKVCGKKKYVLKQTATVLEEIKQFDIELPIPIILNE